MRDLNKRLNNIASRLVNTNKADRVIIVMLEGTDNKGNKLYSFKINGKNYEYIKDYETIIEEYEQQMKQYDKTFKISSIIINDLIESE